MRSFKTFCFSFFCSLILLTACQNPEPFPEVPKKERALLHVLHAYAPQKIDLEITQYQQANTVADGLDFLESWPTAGYAALLVNPSEDSAANSQELAINILDHNSKDVLVPTPEFRLSEEFPTTLCIIDSFGSPMVVRTADDYSDEMEPGNGQIRFLNLSPSVLSVSLVAKNDSFAIENFNFLNYSEFEQIPQGRKTFYFVNDFTDERIDSIVNIDIRSRHTYSFFLVNDENRPIAGYEILDQ
ncbi:MAG: hypothetical protein AAF927_26745 [Bacteroidota bacterium]